MGWCSVLLPLPHLPHSTRLQWPREPDQRSLQAHPLLPGAALDSSILIAVLLTVGVRESKKKKIRRLPVSRDFYSSKTKLAIFEKAVLNLQCLPRATKLFRKPLLATDRTQPERNSTHLLLVGSKFFHFGSSPLPNLLQGETAVGALRRKPWSPGSLSTVWAF